MIPSVRFSSPQIAPTFGGVMDDLQTRRKMLESSSALQSRQESIQNELAAIETRLSTLNQQILQLPKEGQLTGIELLTLIQEMQRKNNRSLLKNVGRLATLALTPTVVGGVLIVMLGLHLHAFKNGPREAALAQLLYLPSGCSELQNSLNQLQALGLVKHITWSPPDISGDDSLSVNRWELTRLGKKIVTQWKAQGVLNKADVTLTPNLLSLKEPSDRLDLDDEQPMKAASSS